MKNEDAALIVRGILSLGRRLRAERPRGSVSLSALAILGTLRRKGPMPAARIATEENLQPQSLTRLLAGLEEDGLIVRKPGEIDRREKVVALTEQGLSVLVADIAARSRWLETAMADLEPHERDTLLHAAMLMARLADRSE
jgi:DNA-binding MarR family transcriptional regulator